MTTPTLTARTPEDLLAAVRVVLGFEPDRSLVMLTFGADHTFHARVDLPPPGAEDELAELGEVLLRPVLRHSVATVLLVLFTDDDRWARRSARCVREALADAGVGCLDAVRAHDGRWHRLPLAGDAPPGPGVPYDVSHHPFVAAAVLDGRVIHGSRAALARTLDPDPAAVAEVDGHRPTSMPPGEWVAATVARHATAGTVPAGGEAARLLEALAVPLVRDAAWGGIRRPEARRHVALWTALVQRCPDDLVPHAASVLAFAAWLAGDGALGWCAVDRARRVGPDHSLACLVADLLEAAVPPRVWDRRVQPLGSGS